jgi:DNA polymerase-3 subunit delta
MKLDARRAEAFLRAPGPARVVLLHGEDAGLIRDRGSRLTRAVAGDLDDPFRVVELDRDGHGRIADELASLPLTGGRRVVRVRDVGEAIAAHVQAALAGGGQGLLILEAPGLASRSRLRTLLEKAEDAAVIACRPPEPAALAAEIRAVLHAGGVTADSDVLRWLESRLGADLLVTRSEIEKLALYAGSGGRVDIAAAQLCVGDLAGLSVDDAVFAATAGDVAAADRSLEIALTEGATPVAVVRAALLHVQRLHRARIAMRDGATLGEAVKGARPPVFFRREPDFQRALAAWTEPALAVAAGRLFEADRACKRTGAPGETICRNAVIGLAQRGAVAQRRERPGDLNRA